VIRIVFWGLIALDVAGVALLFLLGLAAAGSARGNSLQGILLLALVCAPLVLSVVMFSRTTSPAVRLVAVVIAAMPLVLLASGRAIAEVQLRLNTNEQGELTFFRSGPMREIAEAITRNDTAAVARLVKTVDVNETGLSGMTLLVVALQQLRKTPEQQAAVRLLLDAGANPNTPAQYEVPLSIALQVGSNTGPEPVKLLLDAGADPNAVDSFGTPVWFLATARLSGVETLAMLLDRGASINAVSRAGATALFSAANTRNWKAASLLLERGADWKLGKSVNGVPFRDLIDGYTGAEGGDSAFVEVKRFLDSH
jgi:hypothetical protein